MRTTDWRRDCCKLPCRSQDKLTDSRSDQSRRQVTQFEEREFYLISRRKFDEKRGKGDEMTRDKPISVAAISRLASQLVDHDDSIRRNVVELQGAIKTTPTYNTNLVLKITVKIQPW